jgi:hypothetical protein
MGAAFDFDFLDNVPDTPNYTIVATVRGTCGRLHLSVEEWRRCSACDQEDPHTRFLSPAPIPE